MLCLRRQRLSQINTTMFRYRHTVLGKNVALALVQGGLEREGQTLYAANPLRGEHTPVRVVQPVFFDPEGERVRG